MITIFFGANDICSAQCFNPKDFSPLKYSLYLRRTLDFLRETLPRTLVNLMPAIGGKIIFLIFLFYFYKNKNFFN